VGRVKTSRQSSTGPVRRALLVGAGGWGRVWAALLHAHPRVELVGWYDILPGVAASAATELGFEGVATGSSLREALDGCGADFLVNLTVPSAHREVAITAMERGLPVLCEKPLSDTVENAVAMIRSSERTGCLLVINQQRRYDRNIAAMRRLIDEHLGSVGILNADFYLSHPERPFHQPM
jgi:predicted dehydrogenase